MSRPRSKTKSRGQRLTHAERRARTRAALFAAAWAVFLRRGYAGASVEEICAEAGYTRGAFYYHFDSTGELFAELLQERVYASYRERTERRLESGKAPQSVREAGAELGEMQASSTAQRLLRLWLELLAASGRDERLRGMAAGFWSGNRKLLAELVSREYEARKKELPAAPEQLASAVIALDIGLAIQHHVDPEAVPLDFYPDIFEALFGD